MLYNTLVDPDDELFSKYSFFLIIYIVASMW
jgi:hypothetical protein